MTSKIGRKGVEWERVRAQVLAGSTVCQMPHCLFPGVPLNPDDKIYSPTHPSGWRPGRTFPSVDHILPVSATEGWSVAEKKAALLDPHYLRPAHLACNSHGGAKITNRRGRGRIPAPRPTRDWGV